MELEIINKLYLELSQFATAKTERELKLENTLEKFEKENSNVAEPNRYNVLADVGGRLLPCPFCGLPPAIGSLGGDNENWAIWCVSCGMACAEAGLNGDTKEDIIKVWNKRANVS